MRNRIRRKFWGHRGPSINNNTKRAAGVVPPCINITGVKVQLTRRDVIRFLLERKVTLNSHDGRITATDVRNNTNGMQGNIWCGRRDTSSVVASIFSEYLITPGMCCLTYNHEITSTRDAVWRCRERAVSFWAVANFLFNINVPVNLARTPIDKN